LLVIASFVGENPFGILVPSPVLSHEPECLRRHWHESVFVTLATANVDEHACGIDRIRSSP
jgi:hypothetical protein